MKLSSVCSLWVALAVLGTSVAMTQAGGPKNSKVATKAPKKAACKPEKKKVCWLTGGGTIDGTGQPLFSFGGNVFPGCNPTSGDGGNWNIIDHENDLHFQITTITNVECGNVEGIPPGSTSPVTPFNFIEFRGTGTVTGIGGNEEETAPVAFFVRAEDRGEPGGGIDRLLVQVTFEGGETVTLIGTADGAPVPISTGNLQIHISSCNTPVR